MRRTYEALCVCDYVILPLMTVGPVITRPPRDDLVVSGSNVSFICSAEGLPRPSITWFALTDAGPMELVPGPLFSFEITEGPGERNITGIVTLINVQPIRGRSYTCNSTNIVSEVHSTVVLTVHSELLES